jgi:predicted transcriptional regulator
MLHLAIFTPGFIEKIFTGKKTIESRFSQIKCAPFDVIEKGDLILMKKSGGPVVGYFVAGTVSFYNDPSKKRLSEIVKKHWDELALTEDFWKQKQNSKYLTLIEIKKPTKFRVPVSVKKHNLSGWVCLGGESQSQISLF